jgi:ribosome-binding protein aMBF1 (putative translation factor)
MQPITSRASRSVVMVQQSDHALLAPMIDGSTAQPPQDGFAHLRAPITTPDIRLRFGTAVKRARKRLGLTQEAVAERAELHRTYVADIERGARNVSLVSIEKLAHALEFPLFALFHDVDGDCPWNPAEFPEVRPNALRGH